MSELKTIFINRRRNSGSLKKGRLFTSTDYNFDYRGNNIFLLLLKAWITSTEIPQADIYFTEGCLCFYVAYFLRRRHPKSRIVVLVAGPDFHPQQNHSLFSRLKKKIRNRMCKSIDLCIAVSEMVAEDVKKVLKCPVEIAPSFTRNSVEKLTEIKADLNSKSIVYIADRPIETGPIKGLDIAVEAFKILRSRDNRFELYLMGAGTEALPYNSNEGIYCLGYGDPVEIFPKCKYLLAPSRYDTFNVATMEAAMASVIPIVSTGVGAKSVIESVNPLYVVDSLDPRDFAERINEIEALPRESIIADLERLKEKAVVFNEKDALKRLRDVWDKFVVGVQAVV